VPDAGRRRSGGRAHPHGLQQHGQLGRQARARRATRRACLAYCCGRCLRAGRSRRSPPLAR